MPRIASSPAADVIAQERFQEPANRRRLSGSAMRTFLKIADCWDLPIAHQRALLGWPAESTYFKHKSGDVATLSYDTLVRISLVIGIYKALRILYPDVNLSHRWVHLPNTNLLFGGLAPVDQMAAGGIDALYRVRRLLDSRVAG